MLPSLPCRNTSGVDPGISVCSRKHRVQTQERRTVESSPHSLLKPVSWFYLPLSLDVTACTSVLPSLSPSESQSWGGEAGFWKLSLSPYLEDFRSLDLSETFSQSSLISLISSNTLSFSILCEIQFKCVQAFHRSAGPLGGVKCGKLILFSISFCVNYGQDINWLFISFF